MKRKAAFRTLGTGNRFKAETRFRTSQAGFEAVEVDSDRLLTELRINLMDIATCQNRDRKGVAPRPLYRTLAYARGSVSTVASPYTW